MARLKLAKIKFIPLRQPGEPKGELLEGEVLYTSKGGRQKVVRTEDHSIHLITDLEGPEKLDDEWESVSTIFSLQKEIEHVERVSEMYEYLGKLFK